LRQLPRPRPQGLMNTKKNEKRGKGMNAVNKPVQDGWHKIDGTPIEDLEKYIYDYLKTCDQYDMVEIMVGTDGASRGLGPVAREQRNMASEVKLLSVICFRKVGKGVHIIKRRERHEMPYYVKTADKLNMEVNKTYELVNHLKEIGVKPKVHLDLNPNELHGSYDVYKNIHGWFESMGYDVEYKPEAAAAMSAADYML
jgi:predicted RNase H-related nuclease YkuK (DUF458 family)